jgi:hypothetical protein
MFQSPDDKFDHHRFGLSCLYAAQPRKRLKKSYKKFQGKKVKWNKKNIEYLQD